MNHRNQAAHSRVVLFVIAAFVVFLIVVLITTLG